MSASPGRSGSSVDALRAVRISGSAGGASGGVIVGSSAMLTFYHESMQKQTQMARVLEPLGRNDLAHRHTGRLGNRIELVPAAHVDVSERYEVLLRGVIATHASPSDG